MKHSLRSYDEKMKNEIKTTVFADCKNEQEYKEIKGESAFSTVFEYRVALRKAVNECRLQGHLPEIVVCDKDGYCEFLKKNNTANSDAYVAAKFAGTLNAVPEY